MMAIKILPYFITLGMGGQCGGSVCLLLTFDLSFLCTGLYLLYTAAGPIILLSF